MFQLPHAAAELSCFLHLSTPAWLEPAALTARLMKAWSQTLAAEMQTTEDTADSSK